MTAGEEDDLAAKVAGTSIGGATQAEHKAREDDGPLDMGDIPDIDDEDDDELGGLGEGVEEADDPATLASRQATAATLKNPKRENRLVSVRTYDCLITYDKYYQTPRMWLVGYNESGQPLKPTEIFEDISSDYAQKTVTVEPFPHSSMSTASIHPCKHASVMKKVIERMNAGVVEEQRKARAAAGGVEAEKKKKKGWGLGGAMKKVTGKEAEGSSSTITASNTETGDADDGSSEVEGLRVDQYLLIFLKFMASIVPAIEIDATQAV
jgi:ubiquitin-like-conjugating enzyme ATG3